MTALPLLVAALWGLSELALSAVKHSARTGATPRDASSLRVVFAAIGTGLTLAFVAARHRLLPIPGAPGVLAAAALLLILAGIALRWAAIRALGRLFTVDVAIAAEHRLVDGGVYRRVRHPAYLGSLLSFAGLGIALGSVVSLAALLAPIGAAFAYRIAVEERALEEALGPAYRSYRARTWRLVPGVY